VTDDFPVILQCAMVTRQRQSEPWSPNAENYIVRVIAICSCCLTNCL